MNKTTQTMGKNKVQNTLRNLKYYFKKIGDFILDVLCIF